MFQKAMGILSVPSPKMLVDTLVILMSSWLLAGALVWTNEVAEMIDTRKYSWFLVHAPDQPSFWVWQVLLCWPLATGLWFNSINQALYGEECWLNGERLWRVKKLFFPLWSFIPIFFPNVQNWLDLFTQCTRFLDLTDIHLTSHPPPTTIHLIQIFFLALNFYQTLPSYPACAIFFGSTITHRNLSFLIAKFLLTCQVFQGSWTSQVFLKKRSQPRKW